MDMDMDMDSELFDDSVYTDEDELQKKLTFHSWNGKIPIIWRLKECSYHIINWS